MQQIKTFKPMRRKLLMFLAVFAMFPSWNNLFGETPPNNVFLYKGSYEKAPWGKAKPPKGSKDNDGYSWSLLQKGVCLYLSTYSQEADIYIQDKRNRTVFKQSVGTNDSVLEISTAGLRPGEYYICILTDDEMWYGSFEI